MLNDGAFLFSLSQNGISSVLILQILIDDTRDALGHASDYIEIPPTIEITSPQATSLGGYIHAGQRQVEGEGRIAIAEVKIMDWKDAYFKITNMPMKEEHIKNFTNN